MTVRPRRRLSRSLWRLFVAAVVVLLALGWSEETFRARFGVLRTDLGDAIAEANSRVRALGGDAAAPSSGGDTAARAAAEGTAGGFRARVTKVVDGDSLVVRHEGERIELRLWQIDAPEYDQPWGERAERALAGLVARREVRVVPVTVDDYGRTIADVFVDDLHVNRELVRRGAAWVYRRYSDDARLAALQQAAQAGRRGLWSLPEAARIPPWEWRQRGR